MSKKSCAEIHHGFINISLLISKRNIHLHFHCSGCGYHEQSCQLWPKSWRERRVQCILETVWQQHRGITIQYAICSTEGSQKMEVYLPNFISVYSISTMSSTCLWRFSLSNGDWATWWILSSICLILCTCVFFFHWPKRLKVIYQSDTHWDYCFTLRGQLVLRR